MAKLAPIVLFLVLSLCTFAQAEEETINFATSVSMLKNKQYLVGPLWIVANRYVKDPMKWDIKLANASEEEIYHIKVVMIFYNDDKTISQNVMRIYDGTFEGMGVEEVSIRAAYKHTHIGFSALVEK